MVHLRWTRRRRAGWRAARRRAAREEKLRERAMLPTPATVAAASVYADPDGDGGEEPPAPVVAQRIEPSAAEMAAAAAGQQVGFYTSGMQDASDRNNRFTSDDKVEAHRQMAIAPSDWFGSGIHGGDEPAAPGVHPAYRHKVPDHLKGRYDPERGDWRCDRCASWNFQRSKECWQCKAGGRAGGATDAAAADGEGADPAQPMPPPPPPPAAAASVWPFLATWLSRSLTRVGASVSTKRRMRGSASGLPARRTVCSFFGESDPSSIGT
mmetsp:Transcript_4075/g.13175  ORF Transcript_4075/g.13175 Transcript_4075/m.13175 type:complete len:267 (+) Transcript_4075:981-1781(+)